MVYTMKTDGMEEISKLLEKMADAAPAVAAKALYEGAGIMSAEINSAAAGIRTGPGATRQDARYATEEEKAAVQAAGAGIAKFKKDGTEVDTSVGYKAAGYATINGKTKPVPLIVNAINSGTSFMHKQPFVRRAAKSGGAKAMAAISKAIEDAYEDMNK